jgi:hypothetical protein
VFLGAGLTIGGCYGLGCALTRRIECSWAVRFCAGAAVLSLLVFALNVLHLATPTVLTCLAVACTAGFSLRRTSVRLPQMPWWAATLFLIYGTLYLANATGPEVEADPNVYHLTQARQSEISFYERLPHAIELLFSIALPFGGAPAAKLVHFAFLIATIPLIVKLGGYPAALLYFMAPVVAVSGTSAFNDAALVCATVAMVVVLKDDGPPWLAGLLAGFCYGIKMTGGLAIPVGLAMLLWKRKHRAALVFACVAAIPVLPWVLRNLIQTGNPFAPFFNAWFPNPYFHIATEQQLSEALRSYGIAFRDRFTEVLWGWRVHGMVGPAFILAPLALASPLAVVMTIPWWLNAGARFLMPALPFIASEMTKRLPRYVVGALIAVQAVASWPNVMELYEPRSWRMTAYTRPVTWDYHVAKMVEKHTTPRDRIFDIHGVHGALVDRQFFGSWHSARNEIGLRTLEFARIPGEEKLYEVNATFPRRMANALRIKLRGTSVVEVEMYDGDFRLPNRRRWSLDAKPNPRETPLAFDGNLATRWMAFEDAKQGQYLSVDFEGTESLTRVRIVGTRWDGEPPQAIELLEKGSWMSVPYNEQKLQPPDLRPQAIARLKRDGFTHIVARAGYDGSGQLGYSLANYAPEWRIDVLDSYDTVYLFKLR